MNVILCVLSLFVYVNCAPLSDKRASFCSSNDCPLFDVITTKDDMELRRYKPSKWVTTMYYAKDEAEMKQKGKEAFWKLFKYIQGANENDEKIAMTVPVTTKVIPCPGENCAAQCFRSFYIPVSHQENTPAPTNEDVFVEDRPAMNVYVKSFGGYANYDSHMSNLEEMSAGLGDEDLYHNEYFLMAGYDSPWKFWNRHNEGWLVAKNQGE